MAKRVALSSAILEVLVSPRAPTDAVGPFQDGLLHLRVMRPPADGEANRAAARLLAAILDLPINRIELVSGGRSRRKRFRLSGLAPHELSRRLAARLP
jgi:uncharacterized protein YggU (UPF0235/DUF167 family)